jgi:hypothetical protein
LAKAHDLNKGVTEFENLKSHFATSGVGWGRRRSLPYADAIHRLMAPPAHKRRQIGFHAEKARK